MKHFIALVFLTLLGLGAVQAQGNGNGNGNTGGTTLLPNSLVVNILQEALPYFHTLTGVNFGQLIQAYRQGACTIELMQTTPPSLTFRVSYGGQGIQVTIDTL